MEQPVTEAQIFDIPIETALAGTGQIRLLEDASRIMGEVNNFASGAMEFGFAIQALKNAEALASARIEGTTGNLQDLYMEEAIGQERKVQLKLFSAINYRMAMNEIEGIVGAYKKIDLPLIRHLHKILSENDPATKGVPGKFREEDVRIRSSRLGDFIPPHHLKVDELMGRFAAEIPNRKDLPSLIQAAITHYQFESIHPFRDGNGRTGRMLITGQLLIDGSFRAPMLNLSQYFDEHREDYVDNLRGITEANSYQAWIRFFLLAVKEQGAKNLVFIDRLRAIEKQDAIIINERLRSPAASHILRHALNKLFITVPSTEAYLASQHISSADLSQVARTNMQRMVEEGVLEETELKFGKARVYAHKKLRDFMFGVTAKVSQEISGPKLIEG
jgi:Fic family protein